MRDAGRRYGTGYLYITHDLGLASTFCDRIAVMQHGRIVEQGDAVDVITRPAHPYTAALLAAAEGGRAAFPVESKR